MDGFSVRVEEALRKRETIVFSADCEVAYSGRAEAFLPRGDRLFIIKRDGTLLVHQPTGSNPINYMKEGCAITLDKTDDGLFLRCRHQGKREWIDARLFAVHFIHTQDLFDSERQLLGGSERDMSDMLFANPSMIEPGFVPLSREEHTRFGFIDVFGTDAQGTLTVVECKRCAAGHNAVQQLARYVSRIREAKGVGTVRGIIAAPRISAAARKHLDELGFGFVAVEPPKRLERYKRDQTSIGDF
ncbi:endonuclease NucS [Candidatus Woesearchaeota archaeon]|nr:endonuclease NucS [Candidatus Woesearchaeota archaeon]